MASSPPGGSYASLTNPKKRPSISTSQTGPMPSSKKPRLSHPLRQTSFPASEATAFYASANARSARSETGSVANSALSSTSAAKPAPRGRGRPRKSTTLNDDDLRATQTNDASSQIEGSSKNRGAARSVVSANQNAEDEDAEDEGDIDGMIGNVDDQEKEEDERQTQRRDRLKEAFNLDQYNRFEKWRAVTLSKNVVKRMVNQTVSQSVTTAPLQAINIYAKWFVAEMVERAREVQHEWAEAYEGTQAEERKRREDKVEKLEAKLATGSEKMTEWDKRKLHGDITKAKKEAAEYLPNPHRGGLLPDHLREALRRYKSNGDGGGVGLGGLSHPMLGVQGSEAWTQGNGSTTKRLFK